MKIKHKEDPIPLRMKSYPPIGDQLDALYKGFKEMQGQGQTLPESITQWLGDITQVKETFKKEST